MVAIPLDIKGFYQSVEINNSAFPTLGLARANVIKNLMASKGVDFKNMNTFGVLDNKLKRENDTIKGVIGFNISDFKQVETVIKEQTIDTIPKN